MKRRAGRSAVVSGLVAVLATALALQERGDGVLILAPVALIASGVALASVVVWLVLGVRSDLRR